MTDGTTLLASTRRWWFLIALGSIAAALAGLTVVTSTSLHYRSSTQLLVGPVNAPLDTIRASSLLVQSYAEIATSNSFLLQVRDRANVGSTPEQLKERMTTIANDKTRVLTIEVDADSPGGAALLANSMADELIETANQRDDREEGLMRVLSEATPAESPEPRPTAILTVLSGIAGAAVMTVCATLIDHLPWRRQARPGSPDGTEWLEGRVLALVRRSLRRPLNADQLRSVSARVLLATAHRGIPRVALVPSSEGQGVDLAAHIVLEAGKGSQGSLLLDLSRDAALLSQLSSTPSLPVQREYSENRELLRFGAGDTVVYALTPTGSDAQDLERALQYTADASANDGRPSSVFVYCDPILKDLRTARVVGQPVATVAIGSDHRNGLEAMSESLAALIDGGAWLAGAVIETRRSPTASGLDQSRFRARPLERRPHGARTASNGTDPSVFNGAGPGIGSHVQGGGS